MSDMPDEIELQQRAGRHPALTFIYQKGDRVVAAVPKTFQASITLATAFQAVEAMLAHPRNGDALSKCSPQSIYNALTQGLALGLHPSPAMGHYAIVPYSGVAQFQMMYKGILELADRSGKFEYILTGAIGANDDVEDIDQIAGTLKHRRSKESLRLGRGEIIGAYCLFKLKSESRPHLEILDKRDIDKIAKGAGPWNDYRDQMARKAAAKRALKWVSLTPELARALAEDMEEHDVIEAEPQATAPAPRRQVAAPAPNARQLPNHGEMGDLDEQFGQVRDRERVPAPASNGRPAVREERSPFEGDDGEDIP